MMLQAVPVFRKDLRLLSKQMLAALAFQGLLMVVIPLLAKSSFGGLIDFPRLPHISQWFPKIQLCISAVIALVAAAQWSVEERITRNVLFLQRLAASRLRVWGEKALAAAAILTAIVLLQCLWYAAAQIAGLKIWDPPYEAVSYIVAVTVTAYLIGLPLSCRLNHSINVILIGLAIELVAVWLYAFVIRAHWEELGFYILLLAVLGLPTLAAIMLVRMRRSELMNRYVPREFQLEAGQSGVLALTRKQVWENATLYAVVLVILALLGMLLLLVSRHTTTVDDASFLTPMAVAAMLSVILGTTTYSEADKQGIRCMLYHYPIPRTAIFWTKFVQGLFGAFLLSLLLILLTARFNSRALSFLTREVWTSTAWVVLITLVPYCCGVLVTHGFKRSLYAVMAALPVVILVFVVISYLESLPMGFEAMCASYIGGVEPASVLSSLAPRFPWTPFLIVVGLALAGWRAATSPAVLSGSSAYRQIVVIRLLLFVLAVVVLVTKTGLRNLFFLITRIDLGVG